MDFRKEFNDIIKNLYPKGFDWDLVGVLAKNSKVYTLSYDSKILSGIFEILIEPLILKIVANFDLELKKGVQNQYPEFTLIDPKKTNEKIAIDVKSTYRHYTSNGKLKPFSFTLGSYRSYLQDPKGKKGILFPYHEYAEHWVIGFVYDRNPECTNTEIKDVIEAINLQSPYSNIEYFVQEKHKIAGKVRGSGNTTNISSIKSNDINDFKNGNGPFKTKEEFENFWRDFD
jgi:hypothetical protein